MSQAGRSLAAKTHERQLRLIVKAERAANAAERAVRRLWNTLLRMLRLGWSFASDALLGGLHVLAAREVAGSLARVAGWAYRDTTRSLAVTIGADVDILFPPLTAEQVNSVVYGGDWQRRLAAATRLAQPERLAAVISSGLLLGKSHQEIAREIRPAVQGVVSSARRVARTECMRVAQAVQMHAHSQLGDLVIGYTLHATLDQHTRSWHRKRDGRKYFKAPGPGQDGLAKMPHPPDEPHDVSERPLGAPAVAYNCRCYLTPILRPS